MKKIAVIGNGKMAIDCLNIMKERSDIKVSLVITEPRQLWAGDSLISYCEEEGIPYFETMKINSKEVIEQLSSIGPAIIFNINSYRIIKEELLSIPSEGIINFHNGPLPRYGGVNVCSWAIINGEKQHGVTWHYMDKGIDTGDIIDQKIFEIAPDETAVRLIIRCIREGVELFRRIFPQLVEGRVLSQKQDTSKATYYSARDIPNGGFVNYKWPYRKFDSFIRGLTFHPMANSFVYPTSVYGSRHFYIQKVLRVKDVSSITDCGRIKSINPDRVEVQIKDSIIGITDILDESKNYISISKFVASYGLSEGAYFDSR